MSDFLRKQLQAARARLVKLEHRAKSATILSAEATAQALAECQAEITSLEQRLGIVPGASTKSAGFQKVAQSVKDHVRSLGGSHELAEDVVSTLIDAEPEIKSMTDAERDEYMAQLGDEVQEEVAAEAAGSKAFGAVDHGADVDAIALLCRPKAGDGSVLKERRAYLEKSLGRLRAAQNAAASNPWSGSGLGDEARSAKLLELEEEVLHQADNVRKAEATPGPAGFRL